MAIDQPGRDPGAAERGHFAGAKTGQFGTLADADDAPAVDPDRGIGEQAERVPRLRHHRRDVAIGKQAVPHDGWQWGPGMLVVKHELAQLE